MIVRCGKMRKSSAKNGSGGSDPSPSMPRIVEVEATATECYSDRREDDDECDDGVKKMKNRRKLKRHEYRLRCKELLSNFKIPYLRISPNPFSIAFLILVIISSDVWPHTKSSLYVSCTPVLFRHYNHKMLTTKVNQQQNVSKSNNLILNDVSNVAGSNGGLSLPTYDKSSSAATSLSLRPFSQQQQRRRSNDNNSNNYDKYVNKTGEMFLKRQSSSSSYSSSSSFEAPDEPSPQRSHEFLIDKRRRRRRRYGRSYKPYSTSISSNHHNNTWYPAPSSTRVDDYSGTQSRSFSKSSSTTSSLISPCSHVGDETNEISARAYMAETIFEAKVRSKSTVHEPGGKYGVTFVVQNVHKDPGNSQNLLIMNTPVRLYFKQKLTTTKPTAHCVQRYNYTRRPGDLTKANIKRGRRYIVFVNGIGPHNYTILGEPVLKTKKNLQAVRDVLCRNCVRPIGVWGLKNVSVDLGKPLHLVCRVKGNPLPALQWFKDGSPIIVTSRLRIQYKKKRSLVVIPEVRNSDAGRYECRGLGVQSLSPVSSSATVDINTRVNNITDLWPLAGKPCPMDLVYCLNGGSCTFYETIGEFTCQCADGFNGARCESKDAINSNSTYAYTCIDGVTPSYPCVTVHKPLD